jgi:hypothetical protein
VGDLGACVCGSSTSSRVDGRHQLVPATFLHPVNRWVFEALTRVHSATVS